MPATVSATEFASRSGFEDWRYILGSIEATFAAPNGAGNPRFSAAAQFAGQIASAADAADHHPDIDLRYPGVVHVVCTTHDLSGLSELDLQLARTISDLAMAANMQSRPTVTERVEIGIDAVRIDAVRPFWAAILGYGDPAERDRFDDLCDPSRRNPTIWFQQMEKPRSERNNLHLDITVPHDEAESRVEAALAAGGTLLSDDRANAFWVLADAEGNEACVCTWQDRD